eukprot:TRINITY_DN1791_c0_g2_i1.p1 TRINITY_DN1791_c0_g2~~TRINITY_DN1791_c0_g2_i1.p1  ORF type:complete len:794 (-),score=208.88 TRINITY_DN1791_c0_g2_i1:36-2144(-)
MQYLVAGARANVGIKSGRYMFEVKIIEALNPAEATAGSHGRTPQPRQLIRVGFSTQGSPLLLGDSDDCVYFDSEGCIGFGKNRRKIGDKLMRDQVVAVVLNLDPNSKNAFTVSAFREGVRVAEPQPLPEALKGRVLFPHVSYRNVSVQVNFGPSPFKPLPFKCRMVQTAALADVVETHNDKPADGKQHEVVVPVGVPDEGTFDWLDDFLQKNPSFVELSDRKLQEWATSSGLPRPRPGPNASNDKPSFSYGLISMDDMSLQRVVKSVASMVPRNYVVMEVTSNLVKEDRADLLRRFGAANFRKTAMVVVGKPPAEHSAAVQARILQEKQNKLDNDWNVKKAEKERIRQVMKRNKEAVNAAKKLKEGDESKDEEKAKEGDDTKDDEDDDGLGKEPPKAELTEEEKTAVFPKRGAGDLAPLALSKSLTNFTLPEKSEGFDEVKYVWEPADKASEYLRNWVLEAKRTTLLEHLQPSKAFTEKFLTWQKQQVEWSQKQSAFKQKPKPERKGGEEDPMAKIDIFSVEDVNDVVDGEPLYANFGPEDWALLQLRCELYLLQDCFRKDADDPDRLGIPEGHLNYYYQKYFRKTLQPQAFHLKSNSELVAIVKDTVSVSGSPPVLINQLSADVEVDTADIFLKFTEEARRERKRRLEAGDETVKLKYTPPVVQPMPALKAVNPVGTPAPKAQPWQSRGGWGGAQPWGGRW